MKKVYFEELLKFYQKELNQTLNFWYKYGYDHEHGGIYTCLSRDGKVFSTDKPVWAEGRGLWVFSRAYNFIKKDPRYLQIAKDDYEFIVNHCFDKDGRMFFTVTEDGKGIQKRRYWFSETFTCIGSAELYRATKEEKYLKTARDTFELIYDLFKHPNKLTPKFNPEVVNCIALSNPMILLSTSQIMREIDVEKKEHYNDVVSECMEEIFLHYHVEKKAVFENVNQDGSLTTGPRGRLVNPGHSIEASWFLMNESQYRNDPELLNKALNILEWSFNLGWDKNEGGLRYFVDVEGLPCEQLEWDMKLWWPHCEMLIAFLMAYKLTKKQKYLNKYQLVHDYTFSHFKDEKYGEWYGYLHRDGTVSNDLKGNIFKGPFHIPRMELENVLQLKEMLK